MIQQGFMASEESWISTFGCKGVLIKLGPEEKEVVITETGAEIHPKPGKIDIYDTFEGQPMIGFILRLRTHDVGDLIEAEKDMLQMSNDLVKERLNRELTEEEEGFLHDCLFNTKR